MKTTKTKFIFRLLSIYFSVQITFIACDKSQDTKVFVNQVGYLPHQQKIAVVKSDAERFQIKSAENDEVVYSGNLSAPEYWKYSDEQVRLADFTGLERAGVYHLWVDSISSYDFEISEDVFKSVAHGALKYFYYARASTDLPEKFAGKWHRKAGHPDDKVLIHPSASSPERPEGTLVSCPRGWYDAGDYNKYVVNSGISTYTLMLLYESFPEYLESFSNNIPESENNAPDILDEVLWNIRWLMTMQDPNDGGVYHKLTSKNFEAHVMPAKAKQERYVVQKTTGATLNFAAVLAQATRIFKKYPEEFPGLADSCLVLSRSAWNWAKENPEVYYVQPQDITTGTYGDDDFRDEFAWAACELFITTGEDSFYLNSNLLDLPVSIQVWDSTAILGYMSVLQHRENLTKNKDSKKAEKRFLNFADSVYNNYQNSAYRITNTVFRWGSNAFCLNQAMVQLIAYRLTGNKKYFNAALSNLDYILGKNPLNQSYVTGFGDKSPMHVHHRQSHADNIPEPIPGMVVGGPNYRYLRDCGREAYASVLPALAYIDKECSYATNEVAINWNAPLTFVTIAIDAINQREVKQ